MIRPAVPALVAALVSACAAPPAVGPSLAPRAAEIIDPRLPVGAPVPIGTADAALIARLAELVGQARTGNAAFEGAAARAAQLAGAAGAPESESWIAAQQALSGAVAARAPTTRAIGDIDELGAHRIAAEGRISGADFLAIQGAAAEVAAIADQQAATIERIQRQLGS